MLDKVIKEHRYSPTYEGNLRNNGEILITLSLSEQDNSVLAVLLDGDHIAKNLALTAFPKVQTKPYAEDDSLLIICSDEDVVPGTVLSEEETDKPILRKGVNKFEHIQRLLGLTEKEKGQILSINRANHPGRFYREVWIA